MYLQSPPFSNHNLHTLPSIQLKILHFPPKPQSGFFNSAKRVSVSVFSSCKSNRMSLIGCSAQHVEQEQNQEEEHDDGFYMRQCVELARQAIGCTSPNPMVGCVIVKDGEIVGQGFHPKAGQPHAEVFALRDAGDLAENGTAYVSLEPCNHYGRTPPCTEALIKAKVKKVVVGMVDRNPLVASTGLKKLQDAGIEVKVGVEEEMCKRLNESFTHLMLTGKPFVTLRYSISLDGHLVDQLGKEATECGGYYSKLLQEYDAIVLSSTSVTEASFPSSKEPEANQPLKIVLSRCSKSPIKVPAPSPGVVSKVIIMCEDDKSTEPKIFEEGIETVSFDRIRLVDILEHCKRQGFCSVLLDLMGNLADFEDILKEGMQENLIQKVIVEVLPRLGSDGGSGFSLRNLNVEVKNLAPSVSGKSVLLEGYL